MTRYIVFLLLFNISGLVFSQQTISQSDVDAKYIQGLELMDNSNLTAAREAFESYIATSEDQVKKINAYYYAAFCALSLYHRDGEKLIEDFIQSHPNHPKAVVAYYELGNYYYKSKKYNKVTEYLQKANLDLLDPAQRQNGQFMLGYSYFFQKKFDQALKYFNILKTQNHIYASPSSYYAGYIEFENGQYDLAIADFQRAERNETYADEVPYMIASSYYRKKDYSTLIAYSKDIISQNRRVSNRNNLLLLAAEGAFQMKDYENASELYARYNEATSALPEDAIVYRMAYSFFSTGKDDEAILYFKKVAGQNDETGVYASYYLGILYLKKGNKRYALTAFDNIRTNKVVESLREEGAWQFAKLSYEESGVGDAINAMVYFTETYPNSIHSDEINELLSEAYLTTNDYDKAIQHIEGLKSMSKKVEAAYQKATFLSGTAYFNKRDYRRSVDLFAKSLEHPLDLEYVALANFWSGDAYSVGRRFDEAAVFYQKVLNNASGADKEIVRQSRYGLGYCYFNEKKYDQALTQFQQYVNTVSTPVREDVYYADALVRLADCYYVSKKYQDALSFYKKGMEVNREDKDYILLNTGIIYGLLDNNAEAHRQFENITVGMKESRYYDDALFQNAQLYFNEENYQKAIEHFSRIINEKKNSRYVPYSLMRRASANYNTGKYNPAIEDYLFILKNFTKHETASESLLPLQETLAMVNRGAEFEGYLADYKKANPNQKGLENVEYESAKGFYFSQNYDKAINNLGAFISTYPEDPRVPEAIFYVGESYYRLNKLNKARAEYEKLLNEKAFWQYSLVLGRLAEVYYMQKDYRNAVTYYRRFEGMANNKRQQNDSRTGLMQAYFYLNQYDSSEYYARQILAGASVNVNAQNKANLYIGKSLYGKGDYEQAKDEFLNTINTAKDVSGAEAQYLLGEILYQNGEYQHSIEMLIGLNEEFNVFDEWVGKGFLLIVDNYIAMEDYFQARGTLQSLIENFPDEEVKDKSRAKLRKIDELEKKMKEKNNETAPIDSLVINPGDSTKKN